MKKIPVIVVCGPTASGKTDLGIKLARAFGGEIISADSMQVYRKLDIGTAKPDTAQRQELLHHMIDVAEPTESYSVARYCGEAAQAAAEIANRGKIAVVVGGTGLYIDNFIRNTDFSAPGGNPELRAELEAAARDKGREYLHEMLRGLDSEEAERVHPNNLKRVIRAIELIKTSGESRRALNEKSKRPSPYSPIWFAVAYQREELYERINFRVDAMMAKGLEEEVRRVLLPIRDRAETAAQAIGYKEMLEYFDGRISLDGAVENIKRSTRRYAKRQLTWFGRNGEINWLPPNNAFDTAADIVYKKIN